MSLTPSLVEEYDRGAPPESATKRATFGLGCFWGPDAQFGAMAGVVRTRVGYAGGSEHGPSYHSLGDHTEVVQVDYDPRTLSYADLLGVAFRRHDPTSQPRKRQYQNVVLTHDGAQREAVEAFLAERGLDTETIETRVEHLRTFYPAEDYHQKHALRAGGVPGAFETGGYDDTDLRESPAAATLNGRAGGHELPEEDDLRVALERTAGR